MIWDDTPNLTELGGLKEHKHQYKPVSPVLGGPAPRGEGGGEDLSEVISQY